MYRTIVIALGFIGVTTGLLFLQPSPKSDRFVDTTAEQTIDTPDVTRGATTLLTPTQPVEITTPEPVTLDNLQSVSIDTQDTPSLLTIDGLEPLISTALAQGMNGAEIDVLITQAVQSGMITVPASMIKPDGQPDTMAILGTLVRQPAATPAPKIERLMGNSYIVRPGDTLAVIAQRYYGSTDKVDEIYWANKDHLPSPDALEPGQTLFLPQL